MLADLVAINLYYGRTTYHMLRETIRLRLENVELVSHLQEERDRAQAADRAKTRFLAAASHDLRQPIHALSLLITTLAMLGHRGAVASGDARDLAGKAKSIVGNLSALLNGLLDISRLDAGVVTVAKETVNLSQLFYHLSNEFAPAAKDRGLDWSVVESRLQVDSDPMMLKRVLAIFCRTPFGKRDPAAVCSAAPGAANPLEFRDWVPGQAFPQVRTAWSSR